MDPQNRRGSPKWQQLIWSGAGVGLLLTITILLAFSASTVSQLLTLVSKKQDADLGFVFASIGLITQTLLRLLSILVGGAVAFAGLAVSFFAHEQQTSAGAQLGSGAANVAKFTLATYAPGIVGVVVGALIIVAALYARGKHEYTGPQTYSVNLQEGSSKKTEAAASSPSGLRSLDEVLQSQASAPSK